MDRVAVFVDAGYLFAQGAKALCGQKLERRFVSLDYQVAARQLTAFAEDVSGLPLLRICWYDGTSIGPTPQHAHEKRTARDSFLDALEKRIAMPAAQPD